MKLNAYLLLAVATLAALLYGVPQTEGDSLKLERVTPEVNSLIAPGAKLEKLATGFKWTEGPVWIKGGYLLFAEIPSNSIRRWSPDGKTTIFLQPSGYQGATPYNGPEPGSNGMTLDSHGRLTVAGHAQRDIWRLETMSPHGHITVLADSYQGKKLNSPNDLVYRKDGSLYFTDPPYGFRTQSDHDPEKQLRLNGVYRLPGAVEHGAGAPPDNGALQLLISDLPRPNGIAFSPDEKILYVDNSEPKKIWMRYQVQADGSVKNGELLYDATSDKRAGSPDGMKVDVNGNLYSTGPGGIWIFSTSGKHIGTIDMPEKAANMAWGDADAKSLYITASTSLYRIRMNVAGLRP